MDFSEGDLVSLLSGSGAITRAGWTAGGGIEATIDNRWSAKLEYLMSISAAATASLSRRRRHHRGGDVTVMTHILRGWLNYPFN